jgi:FAD/FMN-containing dehydrogenase/Fe-S oxidoreductase
VFFDLLNRHLYSTDASIYRIAPLGVILPKTQDDVLQVIRVCGERGVSVTARGGGTSLAGQAVGSGVQIDFSRYLNRILEVNLDQRFVRVEPGAVLDNLNDALAPYNMRFGADVATSSRATLGGMIANNSSGAHSLVHGMTADHVLELKVALSDGTVTELRPFSGRALQEKRFLQRLEGRLYRELPALAEAHAQAIQTRFPHIQRRVSGYNLNAFSNADTPIDLTRIIAGSEGTLALILEAKLNLVPAPAAKGLLVVEFPDVLSAASAVPRILEYGPTAIELIDKLILDQTRGSANFARARGLLRGEPGAVLLVERWGSEAKEVEEMILSLAERLKRLAIGIARTPILDPTDQARIWELRKAGVGLLMAVKGDAKPYAFVEDVAVSPAHLDSYLRRFQQIVSEHRTHASWYGHAGVGCLHVRPLLNLKTIEGRQSLRSILDQVSDLALEMHGSLSGEHGDGIVRGGYLEKMFGPELYQAFRQVKNLFDPAGIFNPNRIVDTPDTLSSLKILPSVSEIPEINTRLDYSSDGGFYRSLEMCSGVGHCRKTLSGSMCPSFMATQSEGLSTRGRSNGLIAALEGRLPEGLANQQLYEILDLCLGCKACKNECPSFVDMTKHKQELLFQRHRLRGAPMRDLLVGHVDTLLPAGGALAWIANRLSRFRTTRWLAEKLLGFDRRRVIPAFSPISFRRRFSRRAPNPRTPSRGEVALFVDCWLNHCQPEVGMASVELLEAAGFAVRLTETRCCGRPALSKGLLDRAARLAEYNTAVLYQHLKAGRAIVVVEPSCLSTMRDDYLYLLSGATREKAREIASRSQLIDEFLADIAEDAWQAMSLRSFPDRVLLHGHCHQKALGAMKSLEGVLQRIPGVDVTLLETSCCGMAGAFGYEVGHYEVSRACVERLLAPAIREAPPSTVVLAPGFSCRQQIAHFTGRQALHPVELLARLART